MFDERRTPYKSTPPAIDMIRGLAPLASYISSLSLKGWQITAEVIVAIAEALPTLGSLSLQCCTLDKGAWRELLTLTSVSELTLESTPCGLVPLTAFASNVRHEVSLNLGYGCMKPQSYKAFEDSVPTLSAKRECAQLPPFHLN